MNPCECGCGRPASTGKRFISGHHSRKHDPMTYYVEEDRGYDSPCWIWQGVTDSLGYGRVTIENRKHRTHRVFYERHVGAIPDGMVIDHLCRVPSCVNPAHLEPVTNNENIRRGANTRLTPEQVREIRDTPRKRGSGLALAEKFGVSVKTIYFIRARRLWADLP